MPQCNSQTNPSRRGNITSSSSLTAHSFARSSTQPCDSLTRHPRLLSSSITYQRFSSISTQLKEPPLPKLPPPLAKPVLAIPQGTASSHVSDERPRLELEVLMPDLLACNLGNLGRGQHMAFPGTLLRLFWRARGVLKSTSEGPQRKVPIVETFLVVDEE
jgi:hypothetical protein